MFQVRFHGRGGQGVVTAAQLLASAAFREDRYAQAFPSFGSERMGAPVMSFCRIDDKPIRTREPVTEPDALLIQDPTLLHQAGLLDGLRPDGYVLVNSSRDVDDIGLAGFAAQHRGHLLAVLLRRLPRRSDSQKHGRHQDRPCRPRRLRDRLRLLQGLRHLRRGVPLRRDRHGS